MSPAPPRNAEDLPAAAAQAFNGQHVIGHPFKGIAAPLAGQSDVARAAMFDDRQGRLPRRPPRATPEPPVSAKEARVPGPWPTKSWPVALGTGGGEPSPAGMTMAGMQSPGQGDLESKERRGDHLLPGFLTGTRTGLSPAATTSLRVSRQPLIRSTANPYWTHRRPT
jgi:hypothetical protein